ncbi:MAG: hypothetical protein WC059_03535 [Candidatus Paceibacterota bacterium]
MEKARILHQNPQDNAVNKIRNAVIKRLARYLAELLKLCHPQVVVQGDWEHYLIISFPTPYSDEEIASVKSEILKHGNFLLATVNSSQIKVRITQDKAESMKHDFRNLPKPTYLNSPIKEAGPSSSTEQQTIQTPTATETQNVTQPKTQTPENMSKTNAENLREEVRAFLKGKNYGSKDYVTLVANKSQGTVTINAKTEDTAKKMCADLKKEYPLTLPGAGAKTVIIAKDDSLKTPAAKKAAPVKIVRSPKKKTPTGTVDVVNDLITVKEGLERLIQNIGKGSSEKGKELFALLTGKKGQLLVRTTQKNKEQTEIVTEKMFLKLYGDSFK